MARLAPIRSRATRGGGAEPRACRRGEAEGGKIAQRTTPARSGYRTRPPDARMIRIRSLLLRRLIGAMPVLAIVVIGGFFMLEAAPGDSVDAYVGLDRRRRENDRGTCARPGVSINRCGRDWAFIFGRSSISILVIRSPSPGPYWMS